jgi:polyhydroxyalkanoate synthesis regulator phasin
MNFDTISELIHKGFRISLGAMSALAEAVQDPQKSSETFSEIGTDFHRLADELEVKGALGEQEGRQFVETVSQQLFNALGSNPFSSEPASETTITTVATPIADASIQAEIKSLTEQLSSIRAEIEHLKDQKN